MLRPSKYIVIVPVSEGIYLFVNTFTGVILQGTEKVRALLSQKSIKECDNEYLSELHAAGFLTELTPQEEIAVQDFDRQIKELNPKRKRKSELGT